MLDAAFWGHIWVLRPKEDREDPCCLIKNNTQKRHACEALKIFFHNTSVRCFPKNSMLLFYLVWFLEEDKFCLRRSHVVYTAREGGGGSGGGRGEGGEGLIQNSWKKGRGEGGGQGRQGWSQHDMCVSLLKCVWIPPFLLRLAEKHWRKEESASALRPSLSAAKTTSTESSQCAQGGWEIGSEPSVYPECLSPFVNYCCFVFFFNFHFWDRVFALFGCYQCLER